MRVAKVNVERFRGILHADVALPAHAVLVGDNNSGKSTILEAIDLCLGPDRLSRQPVLDEHDFYAGHYRTANGDAPTVRVEVVVTNLSGEQQRRFLDHLEWWDGDAGKLITGPPPSNTDAPNVTPALRVQFSGSYSEEDDDFRGQTCFASPILESGALEPFRSGDKRTCGFLFLHTLRTGSRALSLERGSLLDVVLRLQGRRSVVWEDLLGRLLDLQVAHDSQNGLGDVLSRVQRALDLFVPGEWGAIPCLRVTDLTRESLRHAVTVFLSTGAARSSEARHFAPFQHQGTGTVNVLVLALLSLIAELKQNVIFAMEEPEIAVPPYTQRQIVEAVRRDSSQAIFTSHSPYVIEAFGPSEVVVVQRHQGNLTAAPAGYPPAVKAKEYRLEIRRRMCEALLARRVLITEGRTEYDAWPVAARRLAELKPDRFSSLESLGIAVVDAATDTQVAPLGAYYTGLGKTVYAVYDRQTDAARAQIGAAVSHSFELPAKGFEDFVSANTAEAALRRAVNALCSAGEWPSHLGPAPTAESTELVLRAAVNSYLKYAKGSGGAADVLAQCAVDEMPPFIVATLDEIRQLAIGNQAPGPEPVVEPDDPPPPMDADAAQ